MSKQQQDQFCPFQCTEALGSSASVDGGGQHGAQLLKVHHVGVEQHIKQVLSIVFILHVSVMKLDLLFQREFLDLIQGNFIFSSSLLFS